MIHSCKCISVLASVAFFLAGSSASAQTLQSLFFDDFESYNLGTLDKNDTLTPGPNQAPNGSGNPWFGPEVGGPNLIVVGPVNGVTPHSGQQMLQGRAPSDIDQDWYNLAYRLNNGSPFPGNIALDWWFYDPLDPNDPNADPTSLYDFVALGLYDSAPGNTDAPGDDGVHSAYNLNHGFTQIQRLCLGAGLPTVAGYDPTMYQARVVGADDGLANGWFNTLTPRSQGWHHCMILVGPALADGTNDVMFFIDDLTTPTLEHNSVSNFGYNVIELNSNFRATTAYYDDINFSAVTQ
jgi:hypothetical protein